MTPISTFHTFRSAFILLASSIFVLVLLQSCALSRQDYPEGFLIDSGLNPPTKDALPHCHSTGCQNSEVVQLNAEQWQEITHSFLDKAHTAEQERQQISIAISHFEKIVGKLAGTDTDVGGTFVDLLNQRQDCVDESTNTTTYLLLLKQNGLLMHHEVLRPSYRFLRNGFPGWPHQSATIRETKSGDEYVVDSWFLDNGEEPFIVPLHDWTMGWQPGGDTDDSM